MIDVVSETTRQPWSYVFNFGIIYFFNIAAYAKDKEDRKRKLAERWKQKQRR